jgi:hypothetical protein
MGLFTKLTPDPTNNLFNLRNNGDYADIIIVARGLQDIFGAPTHYVHYTDYNGYINCIGEYDCPECKKGNRVYNYIFLPIFVIDHVDTVSSGKLLFWVRSKHTYNLIEQVTRNYPNPSEYVFRISRLGCMGDPKTSYTINPVSKNTILSFQDILTKYNISNYSDIYDRVFKHYYDEPVKEFKPHKLIPSRFSYNCPCCGAAVKSMGNCDYCGTLIFDKEMSYAY